MTTTTTTPAIRALYAQVEAIEAQYKADIADRVAKLALRMDLKCPLARGKAVNSRCPDFAAVSHVLEFDGTMNAKRMNLAASYYAQEAMARWAEKLAKVTACDSVTIAIGPDSMTAEWTRNGRKCSMVSRAVYKINAHGLAFYQYPTRMKVEGASVTEAEYQAAFA